MALEHFRKAVDTVVDIVADSDREADIALSRLQSNKGKCRKLNDSF